jgi:hypothetical protein
MKNGVEKKEFSAPFFYKSKKWIFFAQRKAIDRAKE